MKVTKEKAIKGAKNGIAHGFLTLLGLGLSAASMKLVDGKAPGWAIALGSATLGFAPHILSENEYAQSVGNGFIAAGGAKGLREAFKGSPEVIKYIPSIDSAVILLPAPAAPASGFGNPDYAQMMLNGLGNNGGSRSFAETLVM